MAQIRRFTREQLDSLDKYAIDFNRAVNADYCRNPGKKALETIHGLMRDALGDIRTLNVNCNHCIVSIMRDCGRAYFRDRAYYRELDENKKELDKLPDLSTPKKPNPAKSITKKHSKS